jgi:DNA-binding FrmR family transcriptional regulator
MHPAAPGGRENRHPVKAGCSFYCCKFGSIVLHWKYPPLGDMRGAKYMCENHTHPHTDTKRIVNRIARAAGHLQSIGQMVEEGRDCSEVLIQLAAVQSALQNTGKVILQDHLKHCIVEAAQEGDTEAIDELCKAIDRYMK